MDTAVTDYISALLSTIWTNLYGSSSTSWSGSIQTSVVMAYAGSTISLFFAIAGAYITGSKLVSS